MNNEVGESSMLTSETGIWLTMTSTTQQGATVN